MEIATDLHFVKSLRSRHLDFENLTAVRTYMIKKIDRSDERL